MEVTVMRVAAIPRCVAISVANAASKAALTVALEVIAATSPGMVIVIATGGGGDGGGVVVVPVGWSESIPPFPQLLEPEPEPLPRAPCRRLARTRTAAAFMLVVGGSTGDVHAVSPGHSSSQF